MNDEVRAAEQNMAAMINNLVNQVEGDTGMYVSMINVSRNWDTKKFEVDISLKVKK